MCCYKVITWQGYHLSILQWDCGPFALHCGVLGHCLDICPPRAQRGQLWRSALHKGLCWHSNGSSLLLVHESKAVCHCPRLTASPSIPRPTACRHHSCSFAEPQFMLDLSSRLFPQAVWLAPHVALHTGEQRAAAGWPALECSEWKGWFSFADTGNLCRHCCMHSPFCHLLSCLLVVSK